MLLAHENLDPHTKDLQGKSALSPVTSDEHSAVKLLSQPKYSLPNSSDFDEVPDGPSPEQFDLPQPILQPIPSSPGLSTDSDTAPPDIDETPGRSSPVLFNISSPNPSDLLQTTMQLAHSSPRPPTNPVIPPPDSVTFENII
ncbi:hypothetical protein L873DRAFT_1788396 [Choiromyces venosus 120613-1]|uniref:Uncharacterized protein n=1 Tax=Choiromyces venosus 120613-1 TaxID=1336337 RepID=A0A3N4JWY7_9PEZI|nr:hypothetical protein L873DRAFT_1788396 [Choiromyces venosus 120613-1]